MKNWIIFGASIAGALCFYFIAWPITAAIMITVTFMLPYEMQGINIFIPFILYFLTFFLYFKTREWIQKYKSRKNPLMLSL